jgi:hypothetical protein
MLEAIAATEIYEENYLRWTKDLHALLHSPGYEDTTHITITITDMGYQAIFQHWFHMVQQPPPADKSIHNRGVIVALDTPTCEYLRNNNAFFKNPPSSLSHNSTSYFTSHQIWCMTFQEKHKKAMDGYMTNDFLISMAKMISPRFVIEANLSVIISEMDIFWNLNPILELESEKNKEYDFQVSSHVIYNNNKHDHNTGSATTTGTTETSKKPLSAWHVETTKDEVNIGFFYVRPTSTSFLLYLALKNYAILHNGDLAWKRTFDQKMYDRFLRQRHREPDEQRPIHLENNFHDFEKVTPDIPVKWRRLPGELYTHNRDKIVCFDRNSTLTIHISFGVRTPLQRIDCASSLGLIDFQFCKVSNNPQCFFQIASPQLG